jgi:CitMHS family citrate-Mg2+:H+ or citrate-Ca2+:H+ symporter
VLQPLDTLEEVRVLTLLGFGMVVVFMALIMTKRLSPLVALITIPIIFALIGGFGGPDLGKMMLDGIKALAPTGVMLMFAILYFGIMIDAGMFDPVVRAILKAVGGDPLKVLVGTAALATFVSLDGDGSTTYMIVVAAMLPLYRRLGMDPLGLTCVTILAGGVMNLTPWGGPLARAASALHVDASDVFVPMLPSMVVGVAGVVALSWLLGKRERQRLGVLSLDAAVNAGANSMLESALLPSDNSAELKRPRLLWFNVALTVGLMTCLILGVLPLSVLFMIAFSIAVVVNYPCVKLQRARVAEHAQNAMPVVAVIFAAGVFTGILSGTGMVDGMSASFLAIVPEQWGPYLATITALASMPFTFFISNDAFYYGVLPIVSQAAQTYGITPVEMARASLIGQPIHLLSPLVPSTYLLVGLAGVEFGDHQKYTLKWAALVCLLMMVAAIATAAFPLVVR